MQNWRITLLIVGACATFSACNPGQAALPGQPPPEMAQTQTSKLPLNEFCGSLAQALCAPIDHCQCPEVSVEQCQQQLTAQCHGQEGLVSAQLIDSVSSGFIQYNPKAAKQLAEEFQTIAATCEAPDMSTWSLSEKLALKGVFQGQLRPGDRCTFNWTGFGGNECQEGWCQGDKESQLRCVKAVDLGDSCDDSRDICLPNQGKDGFGLCQKAAPEENQGICSPLLADGDSCAGSHFCRSGRCERLASRTRAVYVALNLSSKADLMPQGFNPKKPQDSSNYSATIQVYDSVGLQHPVQLYFTQYEARKWQWHARTPIEEVVSKSTSSDAPVAQGLLVFLEDGRLAYETSESSRVDFAGAEANQRVVFDFGDSVHNDQGSGRSGTVSDSSAFSIFEIEADGFASDPFCKARRPLQEACRGHDECGSGYCQGLGESVATCQLAERSLGEACAEDLACQSGVCQGQKCVPSLCSPYKRALK